MSTTIISIVTIHAPTSREMGSSQSQFAHRTVYGTEEAYTVKIEPLLRLRHLLLTEKLSKQSCLELIALLEDPTVSCNYYKALQNPLTVLQEHRATNLSLGKHLELAATALDSERSLNIEVGLSSSQYTRLRQILTREEAELTLLLETKHESTSATRHPTNRESPVDSDQEFKDCDDRKQDHRDTPDAVHIANPIIPPSVTAVDIKSFRPQVSHSRLCPSRQLPIPASTRSNTPSSSSSEVLPARQGPELPKSPVSECNGCTKVVDVVEEQVPEVELPLTLGAQ
jgi:hypothetical protein